MSNEKQGFFRIKVLKQEQHCVAVALAVVVSKTPSQGVADSIRSFSFLRSTLLAKNGNELHHQSTVCLFFQ